VTLDQLRDQIWYALGKPTDLDPDSDVSYNNGAWLTWVVNEGQRQVALWKDPQSGRHCRIHDLYATLNYQPTVLTDTIAAVNNDTVPYYITLTSANANADEYNDWVVEVTSGDADGEVRAVMDYTDGRICYLNDAFDTEPEVGDTVELYKRFEMLLPSTHDWVGEHIQLPATSDSERNEGNLLEVLSIIDVNSGKELKISPRTEKYPGMILSSGDPSYWWRFGGKIFYDVNVSDEEKWYRMEYYRTPTDMVDDDDMPDLPEAYHMAIVMWGIWCGFNRKMESSRAYSVKRTFEDMMRALKTQFDVMNERIDLGGIVKYSEGD
jgi:hypothetical protein